jgi:hypothetical protein
MTAPLPENDELSELLRDLDGVESAPIDVVAKSEPVDIPMQLTQPTPDPLVPKYEDDSKPETVDDLDLDLVYNSSVNELLTNYRKDRGDLDEYIKFIYEKLGKSETSRVFYEALAMALRTKSEANNNLLKLLDNVNKKIGQQNAGSGGVGDLDLESLLDG